MKNLFTFCLVLIILSCNNSNKELTIKSDTHQIPRQIDSLFVLDVIENENFVRIKAPDEIDFSLPDSAAKTEPYKIADFNGDEKADIMVYLGSCGTGGCMFGLFLNRYDNYYNLAFMDYLKSPEFTLENNGFISFKSFEEIEPYNPSSLNVSVYRLQRSKNKYILDSTFVYKEKATH